jgi:DNA-binding transcriptional MerR regulator
MTHFLSIRDAAALTGLTTHTLRYYERIGLLDPVVRRDNSHRLYSQQDLTWIQFLLKLKSTGLPVRDMLRYAELRRAGNTVESMSARRALLAQHTQEVQQTIEALQDNLRVLQAKLVMYDGMLQEAAA